MSSSVKQETINFVLWSCRLNKLMQTKFLAICRMYIGLAVMCQFAWQYTGVLLHVSKQVIWYCVWYIWFVTFLTRVYSVLSTVEMFSAVLPVSIVLMWTQMDCVLKGKEGRGRIQKWLVSKRKVARRWKTTDEFSHAPTQILSCGND